MQNKYWSALPLPFCVFVCFLFFCFACQCFWKVGPLPTKIPGSAPENTIHRSLIRTMCFISISAAVHRPKIGWQSSVILGSSDHRPMIGRRGRWWKITNIYLYYIIMQAYYTKQVILCSFINVMTTSLLRQPFCYLKGFFFTFIHIVRMIFYPFTISKYNSTLTPDERARFYRFQIVTFFQNRPTICRSSDDHRPTLCRWEKSWKKVDRSTKLLTCLLRQRNGRPTKTSSQIIFAHRTSGDGRLG